MLPWLMPMARERSRLCLPDTEMAPAGDVGTRPGPPTERILRNALRDKDFNAMIAAWATPDERSRWREHAGIDQFPDSVLQVATNRFFARQQGRG